VFVEREGGVFPDVRNFGTEAALCEGGECALKRFRELLYRLSPTLAAGQPAVSGRSIATRMDGDRGRSSMLPASRRAANSSPVMWSSSLAATSNRSQAWSAVMTLRVTSLTIAAFHP